MKLEKMFALALTVCLLLLPSCSGNTDGNVTDNKEKEQNITSQDDGKNAEEKADDEKTPDQNNQQKQEEVQPEKAKDIGEIITELGCTVGTGGEYYTDAIRFCDAVKNGDKETFKDFTMGKSEYYDFLDKAEISSYTLYPIEFTEAKLSEMNESYLYPAAGDNYVVVFDVEDSSCDEFTKGQCAYWFGLEIDPISGALLPAFVPIDKANDSIAVSYATDYVAYFIDEFSSLYFRNGNIEEGRNYPDSFDFSNSPHLITHLMARSPAYGEPPYTFDEVNEFITASFDGNAGISVSNIDYGAWTSAGKVYGNSGDPDRIFGCSWGHGGTSAEHRIVNVEHDGDRSIYTVDFFADYSEIALSKRATFYFDNLENGLVKLTMFNVYDDTGREMAINSI